ncbi:hypothetical protein [Streptomyces thermolineatus]|uniref:hypothetical protein n=1 Tax=Streptomyces thermolineatus TaxID=44033 RepID=UPI00384AC3D7
MNGQSEMLSLVGKFLRGEDRSMGLMAKIEKEMIAKYLDDEVYDLLAEPISLYRPGAGIPYYDEGDMVEVLKSVVDILERRPEGWRDTEGY